MTKRLECVIEGCDATIEAESEDAMMAQAGAHAADAHPELELDDGTMGSIRSNVRDVCRSVLMGSNPNERWIGFEPGFRSSVRS
ncbi:DUF1059 domain-containing protein [Halalkalicoccus tibetensis]|uniref:DUF1059 domain-containing protein n=1 Tax=Halalkalicoccus tibetensis TaxID=175632 RepID=A0ABD5UYJ0_9EURY